MYSLTDQMKDFDLDSLPLVSLGGTRVTTISGASSRRAAALVEQSKAHLDSTGAFPLQGASPW